MTAFTKLHREPKALTRLTPQEEAIQLFILAELKKVEGTSQLETTIARNTGLYHPTSCGMAQFRRLVDDLAAKGKVKLGPIGAYGSVEVSLREG
jgi:hypothetical protein